MRSFETIETRELFLLFGCGLRENRSFVVLLAIKFLIWIYRSSNTGIKKKPVMQRTNIDTIFLTKTFVVISRGKIQ